MTAAAIAGAIIILSAALAGRDRLAAAGGAVMNMTSDTLRVLGEAVRPVFSLASMRDASASMLRERNVLAFLSLIRHAEGTADADGYRRLFGGALFESFADHPRQLVSLSGYRSTAAGAYQFLERTWDETARIMGLSDFRPESQDLAALGRIAARGALDDVRAGRFAVAVERCALEWASLPGSPYGQPTISMDTARALYADAGGAINDLRVQA